MFKRKKKVFRLKYYSIYTTYYVQKTKKKALSVRIVQGNQYIFVSALRQQYKFYVIPDPPVIEYLYGTSMTKSLFCIYSTVVPGYRNTTVNEVPVPAGRTSSGARGTYCSLGRTGGYPGNARYRTY